MRYSDVLIPLYTCMLDCDDSHIGIMRYPECCCNHDRFPLPLDLSSHPSLWKAVSILIIHRYAPPECCGNRDRFLSPLESLSHQTPVPFLFYSDHWVDSVDCPIGADIHSFLRQ